MNWTTFLATLLEHHGARVREALAADSLEGRADQLRAAWREVSPSYDWYVCDVFDDAIIVRNDGTEYLRIPYTVTAETITFGTPEKVAVQYAPLGEACIRLLEATGEKTGSAWRVRILKFGRSENGWLWTRESGEALLPHLKTVPVGCYGYNASLLAHASEEAVLQADGAVTRNVVGDIDNPTLEADGVYGDLHIHEDAGWLRTKLLGLEARGVLDKVIGLSIDTLAGYVPVQLREGAARAIKSIQRVFSVDIVTAPSADGRFLRATAGPLPIPPKEEDVMRDFLIAQIREHRPQLLVDKDVARLTEGELQALVKEAMKPPVVVVPPPTEKPQWAIDMERREAIRESAIAVKAAVVATQLPAPVKEQIETHFAGRVVEAAELKTYVDGQVALFAKLAEGGEVRLPHDPARVTIEPVEKMQAALDRLFGVTPAGFDRAMENAPFLRSETNARIKESAKGAFEAAKSDVFAFKGLRQAYTQITGDEDISGRVSIARASETITSSTWASLLANTLYRRMLLDYMEPAFNERSITEYGSAQDFRTKYVTILNYFGDIATVDPESADYTEITEPGDDEVSYAVTQKGNILTISRKTIINDDLRAVSKMVGRLGRAARRTLAKVIWQTNWVSNATYAVDALAWFHATHANTATTALTADATGATAVLAAVTQLINMTEQGSLEKLGMPPMDSLWLDVPPALYGIARMLNLTQYFGTTASNPVYGWFGSPERGERINVNTLLTDTTDWGIHVAPTAGGRESLLADFLQGREEPEFFLADQPTVGQTFVGDRIQYKIRHEYGVALLDYRGAVKNIVAGA